MNNITPVSDALMCSSCGACKAICPKDAINFKYSSIGRKYATVNTACINCGLCVKVCPSLKTEINPKCSNKNDDKYIGTVLDIMTGKANDKEIFSKAQSGGICIAILTYLFHANKIDAAIVCKMSFGKTPNVYGTIVTSSKELLECQKSCYTPVELLAILNKAEKYSSIAIVGLPCHIQGAESLIQHSKKFHNIKYRIGLICDRTLCQGIENAMLSYCQELDNVKIDWRRKDFIKDNIYYSYKSAPVVVYSKQGDEYILPNLYRITLKEMYTPPRCRVCYDKLNTSADIVLGDPWGMSDIDNKKGNSVIIIRTEIGEDIIYNSQKARYISCKKANLDELLNGQYINKRKQNVSYYSKALSVIPQKIDSYLYDQQDVNLLTKKLIKKAEKDIKQFMRYENLQPEEVLIQARKLIAHAKRHEKLNKFALIRFLKIIKSILLK